MLTTIFSRYSQLNELHSYLTSHYGDTFKSIVHTHFPDKTYIKQKTNDEVIEARKNIFQHYIKDVSISAHQHLLLSLYPLPLYSTCTYILCCFDTSAGSLHNLTFEMLI